MTPMALGAAPAAEGMSREDASVQRILLGIDAPGALRALPLGEAADATARCVKEAARRGDPALVTHVVRALTAVVRDANDKPAVVARSEHGSGIVYNPLPAPASTTTNNTAAVYGAAIGVITAWRDVAALLLWIETPLCVDLLGVLAACSEVCSLKEVEVLPAKGAVWAAAGDGDHHESQTDTAADGGAPTPPPHWLWRVWSDADALAMWLAGFTALHAVVAERETVLHHACTACVAVATHGFAQRTNANLLRVVLQQFTTHLLAWQAVVNPRKQAVVTKELLSWTPPPSAKTTAITPVAVAFTLDELIDALVAGVPTYEKAAGCRTHGHVPRYGLPDLLKPAALDAAAQRERVFAACVEEVYAELSERVPPGAVGDATATKREGRDQDTTSGGATSPQKDEGRASTADVQMDADAHGDAPAADTAGVAPLHAFVRDTLLGLLPPGDAVAGAVTQWTSAERHVAGHHPRLPPAVVDTASFITSHLPVWDAFTNMLASAPLGLRAVYPHIAALTASCVGRGKTPRTADMAILARLIALMASTEDLPVAVVCMGMALTRLETCDVSDALVQLIVHLLHPESFDPLYAERVVSETLARHTARTWDIAQLLQGGELFA